MSWKNPKTDWVNNPKNPMAEDFNRIEGNIEFLRDDIETKKGVIVDALDGVGLDVDIGDTHSQIASKITNANQGAKIITPSTTNQSIVKGFHNGDGYVKGDANLKASNIKSGVNIFGTDGSYTPLKSASGVLLKSSSNQKSYTITGIGFTPNIVTLYKFDAIACFVAPGHLSGGLIKPYFSSDSPRLSIKEYSFGSTTTIELTCDTYLGSSSTEVRWYARA